MATNIANLLSRIVSPRFLVVIYLTHIHLWMGYTTNNTKLQTLLLSWNTSQQCALGIIRERTTKRITHIIAKSTDAMELRRISLHRQLLCRISTASCTPSFTIYINRRINLIDSRTNLIHRLDIMHAHQVETETIYMIFIHPIFHALYHKLAHQWSFRCSLIATTRTIRILTISCLAIIIVRISTLEIAAVDVESMIIYSIKNHTDTSFMKCLHHLLEFLDADCRIIRICSITAFWYIIILRIIAPVKLWFVQFCFINRSKIKARLEMYCIDTQLLKIFNSFWFGKSKILTFILQTRGWRNRKITEMQLIDDEISRRFQCRTHIIFPTFRVGLTQIDDSSTITIDANSLGKCTRTFTFSHIKSIELSLQVTLYGSFPSVLTYAFHLNGFDRFSYETVFINTDFYTRFCTTGRNLWSCTSYTIYFNRSCR